MGILFGVVLALAFFLIVLKWWSEGMFETSEALVLATVFCLLIFGLFVTKSVWHFLIAFFPLAGAAGYVLYSYHISSFRTLYKRRCQEYIHTIESDPRNLAARQFLAETLYGLGDLDRAIAEIQAAVDMGASPECRYKLSKWQKEQFLRDTTNPVCRWCDTENEPGARKCKKCGSDLPYDNAVSRWLTGGKTGKIRYYLAVITGLSITSASVLLLPLTLAFIPVLLFILMLVGAALISSARS